MLVLLLRQVILPGPSNGYIVTTFPLLCCRYRNAKCWTLWIESRINLINCTSLHWSVSNDLIVFKFVFLFLLIWSSTTQVVQQHSHHLLASQRSGVQSSILRRKWGRCSLYPAAYITDLGLFQPKGSKICPPHKCTQAFWLLHPMSSFSTKPPQGLSPASL